LQYESTEHLEALKKKRLNHLFNLAKNTTSYYKNVTTFEALPSLSKEEVQKNRSSFISQSFKEKLFPKATGGSTGKPLTYMATGLSRSHMWAGIILSWEAAGYVLGDNIAFVAGSSVISPNPSFKYRIFYGLFNIRTYSAFALNEEDVLGYLQKMKERKTHIIYGYASAIHVIANYLERHPEYQLPDLKGIICTSEMLTDSMRENIKNAFKVDVFNEYGCNEGGVSAFECSQHNLHLIHTRCAYEIDTDGNLVATDLINEGCILMKYQTGDIIEMSTETTCACKSNFPIVKNIIGRNSDIIKDTSNNIKHSIFFNNLFRDDFTVNQFQIQFNTSELFVYLNVDGTKTSDYYHDKYVTLIKRELDFDAYHLVLNAPFVQSNNAKHKHVINLALS
jgi:phenylacetate-CoA ligase